MVTSTSSRLEAETTFKSHMRPVHPGEMLREDFLLALLALSANALAKALRVPAPRINDIVRERRGISADTAMRLARYFGGDARSWLNLQVAWDLRVAEIGNAKRIVREIEPRAAWTRASHAAVASAMPHATGRAPHRPWPGCAHGAAPSRPAEAGC